MKKILILSFIFIFSLSAFAGFVPRKDAEQVAKSHVFQAIASFEPLKWEEIKLNCLFDPSQNDIYKFYVFNINGDQGYVIVSSDDQIIPILAYSFEGGFNFDNMSPGQADFLNYFNESIEFVKNNEMNVNEKAVSQWQELLYFNQNKDFQLKSTSPILLQGINWNQGWPYNSQCPADANAGYGLGGHVPVGCVATAMLQVMKYYNWPPTGTGSKYHSSWVNGGYGNITINFAQQTYDWTAIPDQASSFVNPELGKINYHAGVAVGMYWTAEGSASTTNKVSEALKNYFKYSSSAQYVSKSSYSEANWQNLIKQQVDAKKPMVYSGTPTSGAGHAWNCDGYQDDSFHMNWGWGGAGNGYYTLDNLTSTATVGGEENNFNKNNDMVINIYPDTGFPAYCQGDKLIVGDEGSFDDGSGPEDYQANQSCVFEIKPDCGSVVNLNFTKFDLAEGDVVELYDGDKTSTKLIATLDKDSDYSQLFSSFTGGMTIKFNTDASLQADGWKVKYTNAACKFNMLFTEAQGNLSDGSKSCDYNNSTLCSWIIEPEGANYINIDFVKCKIADNYDYLKIFKDAISAENELYKFNNTTTPPEGTISIPSGKVILQFYTNSSGVDEGWELNYTSGSSDVKNNILLSGFSILPNPGGLDSRLIFTLSDYSNTKIFVTNLLGEIVALKEYKLHSGYHEVSLKDIFNDKPNSGIYFINVDSGKEIKTQKFVMF
ncbi:MAG TPA: C10 family peptidase [Bacteroidales bacterium]|nr:C10 family peptidase [Bacteroidales bacterium]